MGRNTHYESGKYVTLYGIGVDGKNMELKVERDNWEDLFKRENDYNKVYEFSTNSSGVTDLDRTDTQVIVGYAIKLQNGTVAFNDYNSPGLPGQGGTDTLPTNTVYEDSYALAKEDQVWNVTDLANTDDAPKGTFSLTKAKHAILVLDKVRATATKINAAFVWDILPEEENAGLGVTAADVDVAAGADATLTASATNAIGTVAYTWYKSDASGNKQGAALGTGATLTVKSADLVTGANYFLVEVTDRTGDTASKKVTVTVGAPVGDVYLVIDANTDIFFDNKQTKEAEVPLRDGSTGVKLTDGVTTVCVSNSNTALVVGDHYLYNGEMYEVQADKTIHIPVDKLNDGKTVRIAADFVQYYVLTMANGIVPTSDTDGNVYEDNNVYYGKKGATDIKLDFSANTDVTKAIAVSAASTNIDTTGIDGNTAISTNLAADTWIKGAAQIATQASGVTFATSKTAFATAADIITGTTYVAVGSKVYVQAATAANNPKAAAGAGITIADEGFVNAGATGKGIGSFTMPAAGVATDKITEEAGPAVP